MTQMQVATTANTELLLVRHMGQQDYLSCWQAMQDFTNQRHDHTADELWLLEHPPVFTLGQSAKLEHILDASTTPVIPIDRGGQVTYHGPGQLVAYTLIDLKRKQLSIRQFVTKLEQAVIACLQLYGLSAESRCKAPGVYVENKKICSIGLRVRRGYAFHGLALNVNMDLEPFSRINPCGYKGLEMTQLAALGGPSTLAEAGVTLLACLVKQLGYLATQEFKMDDHFASRSGLS